MSHVVTANKQAVVQGIGKEWKISFQSFCNLLSISCTKVLIHTFFSMLAKTYLEAVVLKVYVFSG